MSNPDAIRLRHMQEAVMLALNMAKGRSRADLATDPMLAMALTRCLEILGEAASKLSDELRLRFPKHRIREDDLDAKPSCSRLFRH
jgi:uncharacterized protein with HEPN domain